VTDFPCNISTKENAQPEIEQQFSENNFIKINLLWNELFIYFINKNKKNNAK